jgi:hypothetical protein
MLSRYHRRCPSCARLIAPADIPTWEGDGFDCAGCGQRLKTSSTLITFSILISLLATLVLFRQMGYRGVMGIGIALIAFAPFSFVLFGILTLIFPQRVVLYKKPPFRDHKALDKTDVGKHL